MIAESQFYDILQLLLGSSMKFPELPAIFIQ